MTNFKPSVPSDIKAKLKAFAELAFSEFDSMVSGHREAIGETKLDEIQGNAMSGWWPKQDGGYQVSRIYRSDIDSSYHFTEKQTDYIDGQAKQCIDAFISDNDLDAGTEWDDLTTEQQEEYSQYENSWFDDGALLQLQMFVEGYGNSIFRERKAVTIRMSINYRDEYFQEKYAEDIKVIAYDVEEFLSTPNEEILKEFHV